MFLLCNNSSSSEQVYRAILKSGVIQPEHYSNIEIVSNYSQPVASTAVTQAFKLLAAIQS
jgi:hypothetical protein